VTSEDPVLLAQVSAEIDAILNAMEQGLRDRVPLSVQIERTFALAEQYDLVGMHTTASNFRRHAVSMLALSHISEQRAQWDAERKARNDRWKRRLTLGLWSPSTGEGHRWGRPWCCRQCHPAWYYGTAALVAVPAGVLLGVLAR
jgi:hypothetical protein